MSRRQRVTRLAAICGTAVATIDGAIVNVPLPAIERDLGGGLAGQQWVTNAYLLSLGSLILLVGSLGDVWASAECSRPGLPRRAVGSWTAWSGMALIAGPLAAGWIVDQASWRWIFALNVPPVVATLA
jgi:MFS family permease